MCLAKIVALKVQPKYINPQYIFRKKTEDDDNLGLENLENEPLIHCFK